MKWLLYPLGLRCGWVVLGWYMLLGVAAIYVMYQAVKAVWNCFFRKNV
jgi:hypothetical protein